MEEAKNLLNVLTSSMEMKTLLSGLERGYQEQMVYGLAGSQRSLLLAAFIQATGRPVLAVTHTTAQAKGLMQDLAFLCPKEKVLLFPAPEEVPFEVEAASRELAAQRLSVLEGLVRRERIHVVTTADALVKKLVPPQEWAAFMRQVKVGQRVDLGALIRDLVHMGYESCSRVEVSGTFSHRGGILDLYPLTSALPLRMEFFDDEVDSIRLFDPESQRSQEQLQEVAFGPARELVMTPERLVLGAKKIRREMEKAVGRLRQMGREEGAARLEAKLEQHLEKMAQGIFSPGLDPFQPFFYPEQGTLCSYLPPDALVFLDETGRLKEAVEALEKERQESLVHHLAEGKALAGQGEAYLSFGEWMGEAKKKAVIHLSLLPKKVPLTNSQELVGWTTKGVHSFLGKLDLLTEEIKNWQKRGFTLLLLAADEARRQKLRDILEDKKIHPLYVEGVNSPLLPGKVNLMVGRMESGFELTMPKLVVLNEHEIFGRDKKPRRPRAPRPPGAKIESFLDLKIGDYVVHVNHGIGRYLGLEKLLIGGVQKDYLVVKYAGEDRLYVPTEQVGLIQKYIGNEGASPKLYKLGGGEWSRVKAKVKESVREMANDLLALYAARETVAGYAFGPDTLWQKEFESAFPYEETPDQLEAIRELKADMEKPKPMDRLLCGDVGYGKTEVAIRGAFKGVMEGKQVAVLVPTTILAQQHYNTFRERFNGYPIRVEVLSRFRPLKQQKEVIKGLKEGTVDVVIGTHRLLSDDIRFKDLGLVVVDEEQRFGVGHKEKLKQLRQNVDVLTLSATPIPRTLHMSLTGVRDMSLIETPPEDRFPVQTYVAEYNPELIREAIVRELNRGGQIFFVHNRIQDMDRVERELQRLVPQARIAVAHGQMREEDLEQVMMAFLEGEWDILLCTTIIETGLDIPNVNTLIVDEADHMGLAQLYQLRGRVGRSNRVAYAYFTYRKDKILTEVAEKRLQAIREFTELGSGFKIAMRDLEIRGAGNLLGPEQHGHMMAVGFDLYCRLLEDTIKELKGEKLYEAPEPTVELQVDAFIPESYIPDSGSKIQIYKRLMAVRELKAADELEEELEDRFGDLPEAVANLVAICRLKAMAVALGVNAITQEKEQVRIVFGPEAGIQGRQLGELVQTFGSKITFAAAGNLEIRARISRLKGREMLLFLLRLMGQLSSSRQSAASH